MRTIKRVKLKNFRRFPVFDIRTDNSLNLFVGDNESGKSSVLMALDLVLSGSRAKIDAIGLENLFNAACIEEFMASTRRIEDLPILYVEVYLDEQDTPALNGKNNSEETVCDGLSLYCESIEELGEEIKAVLSQHEPVFPFEYYEPRFHTFAAQPYSGYRRPVRHLFLDSSQINNEYATREYVRDLYGSNVDGPEKSKHQNEYRKHKKAFRDKVFAGLNDRLEKYKFAIKTTGKANLETDLTVTENGITIENKGKGLQCFIKTEFALKKPSHGTAIDILLLEEPENHLSHVNMKKLIRMIRESTEKQLFIATHSNLISARLDLRKCVLMNSNSTKSTRLDSLSPDTADFFMKSPDNNILEFILANKVILVEGDAEYILIEAFFKQEAECPPEECDTHIIAVGGTSFKRYLELAKLLNIRTAVIRDNDKDYQANCVERYADYLSDTIQVFYDKDKERSTFEICLYMDNRGACEALFEPSRRSLSVQEYMLKNKAEAAFLLLRDKAEELAAPQFISDAIQWIRK